VQTRRAQARVALERLADEGQEGIELGRPRARAAGTEALDLDRAAHRVGVRAERGGDRADFPMLGVEEPADLRPQLGRDHDRLPPHRPSTLPPRRPARTPAHETARPAAHDAPLCSAPVLELALSRIGRLLGRDLAPSGRLGGTMIRHARAPTSAQGAHRVAMVRATLRAPLVSGARLAATASPSPLAARVAAVGVAAVAAAAEKEERVAPAARPHPQRVVHVPVQPARKGLDSTAETCDSTSTVRLIHVPPEGPECPLRAFAFSGIRRAARNATRAAPAQRSARAKGQIRTLRRERRHLKRHLEREDGFTTAPSPVYDETNVRIAYRAENLLWRPVGRLVRFVFVRHPRRGELILLCTDTTLDPLSVIALYGYRFKIEVDFRQAIHALGTYAYHFWMARMHRRRRGSGNQDIRKQSRRYKEQVRRKVAAYHRFVQLGCIAQGLLQLLALEC